MPEYANYHVGQKLLLGKGDEYLFLTIPNKPVIDLPGGRIDDNEDETTLIDCLKREIREELGEDVRYSIGKMLFQYRRFVPHKGFKVFITVHEGVFLSGDIKLSDEHSEVLWINPKKRDFTKQDFFSTEEFLAFKNYFAQ